MTPMMTRRRISSVWAAASHCWWLAAALITVVAVNCDTKETDMHERILSVHDRTDAVVIATIRQKRKQPPTRVETLEYDIDLQKTFYGTMPTDKGAVLAVEDEGTETFLPESDEDYLLFLKSAGKGRWTLVESAPAVPVSDSDRSSITEAMEGYAAIKKGSDEAPELRDHITRLLKTGVDFLQLDAAIEGQYVENWAAEEIDTLISIVQAESSDADLTGLARETITAVIIARGSAGQVAPFVRKELLLGHTDNVYWGLEVHKPVFGLQMIQDLLNDRDISVQVEAIRLAGLLRLSDKLDEARRRVDQGRYSDDDRAQIEPAIKEARVLVDRD